MKTVPICCECLILFYFILLKNSSIIAMKLISISINKCSVSMIQYCGSAYDTVQYSCSVYDSTAVLYKDL